MILVLGASGYIGQAFVAELRRRKIAHATISRSEVDYSRFEVFADDREFYDVGVKAPRSNCILDVSKLLATGVSM